MLSDTMPLNEEIKVQRKPRKDKLEAGRGTVENTSREAVAHTKKLPPRQSKMGGQRIFVDFPEHKKDEKNYFYYAVSDVGGNIAMRQSYGYDFAYADGTGEKCIRVGKDGVTLVLMRQPMEYRKEDLELKKESATAIVKAEQKVGDGQYIPDGKKSVVQRDSDLDLFQA